MKLTISDCLICLMNESNVLACHAAQVEYKYEADQLRGLKFEMYKILKEYLHKHKPQQKKINQNQVDIEQIAEVPSQQDFTRVEDLSYNFLNEDLYI